MANVQDIVNMGITGNTTSISIARNRDKVNPDDLVFDELDIAAAEDTLARSLRTLFYDRKITMKQLRDMHTEWANACGFDSKLTSDHFNNMKKGIIKKNKLTWELFNWTVLFILRMHVKAVVFLEEVDGNFKEIRIEL